ncbi:pentapeptide repeat-containing protein [Cystobacter ferrugineus]|uniref:pentapeptide repeat-containing protein n=1 Tax=Cystobacter ferrugineus TaxID=83449 RepID=UPI000A05F81B
MKSAAGSTGGLAALVGGLLPGAFFSGAFLPGAFFSGVFFSGVFFSGAFFSGAFFSGAPCAGASRASAVRSPPPHRAQETTRAPANARKRDTREHLVFFMKDHDASSRGMSQGAANDDGAPLPGPRRVLRRTSPGTTSCSWRRERRPEQRRPERPPASC